MTCNKDARESAKRQPRAVGGMSGGKHFNLFTGGQFWRSLKRLSGHAYVCAAHVQNRSALNKTVLMQRRKKTAS